MRMLAKTGTKTFLIKRGWLGSTSSGCEPVGRLVGLVGHNVFHLTQKPRTSVSEFSSSDVRDKVVGKLS